MQEKNPYDQKPLGTPEGKTPGKVDPYYEQIRENIVRLRQSSDPVDRIEADKLEQDLLRARNEDEKDELAKAA